MDTPPLRFEDLVEGQSVFDDVTITEELLQAFVSVSGDRAPLHTDRQHALDMGFPDRMAHGLLVGMPYSRLLGMRLPGANTVIQKLQLDMLAPVRVGDTLRYSVAVHRIVPAVKACVLSLSATNSHGEVVNRGSATCVFRR
jgi:3-hydroxybutyryl-CoA dehydratase